MRQLQIKTFTSPISRFAIMLFTAGVISSCNEGATEDAENKIDTMANQVEAKVEEVQQDMQEYRDDNLISDIVRMNNEEMHLLALAKQKGTNKELKAHAKMMEADHKKMGEEAKAYAAKKNYTVDDGANVRDGLDDENAGADWDRKWADKMVNDHEKAIEKFEKTQEKANDQELRDMAAKTLPTLRKHLEMSKQLQANLNK